MITEPTVVLGAGGVAALARLLNLRDGYSGLHAERAARLAAAVGERLGLAGESAETLQAAARLHDIGKVGIPDRILHQPNRLTADEWAIVRCHPAWGAEVLAGMPGLSDVAVIVRFHHERWDGTGYPDGLSGEEIPLASLVIGACEAYTSITADRPFRSALSPVRARDILQAGSGSHFAPHVVEALLAAVSDDPALGATPSGAPELVAPSAISEPPRIGTGDGLRGLGAALGAVRLAALAESRQRLLDLAAEPLPHLGRMIGIIETDPGLAVAVVRAACADDRSVRSVPEAVRHLGAAAVADAVGDVPVFDFFQLVSGMRISPERLRLHSVETLRAARRCATALDHREPSKLALAALLHDVGKLALAEMTPAYPDAVHGNARTPEQRVRAERRALTLDHATLGATLLRRWGIPEELAAIVDGHHDEARGGDAGIVRLADMLAHYSTGTPVDPAELLTAARRAGLSPGDLRNVMFDMRGPSPAGTAASDHGAEPSPLTRRERDALTGIAGGSTYKEIALELGVSTSTLRSHLHSVYSKIGVSNRAQAVLVAVERGWLDRAGR